MSKLEFKKEAHKARKELKEFIKKRTLQNKRDLSKKLESAFDKYGNKGLMIDDWKTLKRFIMAELKEKP